MATGKDAHIQIKNESGRLSQADIDRMVREAEENKAQDEEHKQRVDAKNGLENYVYSIRNTINDPKLEGKIPDDDKASITKIVDEAVKWLDTNQTATKEDFEAKKKEVEGTVVHFCKRWLQLQVVLEEECLVGCHPALEVCPAGYLVVLVDSPVLADSPALRRLQVQLRVELHQQRMMVPTLRKLINYKMDFSICSLSIYTNN